MAIISSNIFSIPFSFSSPSKIPIMHRLACFVLPHRCLILLSFFLFKFVFLSAVLIWMISIILSSKSLIYSSALFILLFNAFNSAFTSANEFSIFSWLLLIVSAPFKSNLCYSWQPLLIPSVLSLPPFKTWCLLDCRGLLDFRGLFQCLLLQGDSPVLTGNACYASSFCWYFSYSVSLEKTIIYYSLRELFIFRTVPA